MTSASASSNPEFKEGQEVEIKNLKGASKYNGILGTICGPMINGRYPVKVEGRDKPFNLKPDNLEEVIYEVPNEVESMFSMLERKLEIDRILGCFKLDPFAILNLPYNASGSEIQKHFRKVSLRCHPDKCPEDLRDRAQEAFAKLQAAKASLTDAKKRLVVNEIVDKAKRRVLKKREDRRKQAALAAAGKKKETPAPTRKLTDAEKLLKLLNRDKEEEAEKERQRNILAEGGPDPLKEAEKDPAFHEEVRGEVKEMLIEREWRKRQLLKAANDAEKKAAEEKKEKVDARQQEQKKEENWQKGREKRVGSWRDFMTGKKGKKKKKLKAFKSGQKLEQRDGDRDYIKRIKVEKVKASAL
eukprot:CAMPEP_0184499070 /NCGR_PEP_ID=MMETSP0113_2-20130426/40585_1 /TAXON_ID=91329 /ORGANISM="Norrisiella sphaerica, Strain BC52" /LENGTH=356 /DNA_ID=CAMNT_0026886841 /DNA_START=41 /DNA_END=1111 /DNA_ORIENTATION=-